MEYYEKLWKAVESYGKVMEDFRRLWKVIESYGILGKVIEHYRILWKVIECYGKLYPDTCQLSLTDLGFTQNSDRIPPPNPPLPND